MANNNKSALKSHAHEKQFDLEKEMKLAVDS